MNNIPDQNEFLRLKNVIVAKFLEDNWLELGMVTNSLERVQGHDRLLRSLGWNDSDYPGNAMNVLLRICAADPSNFDKIKDYVDSRFSDNETFVSSKPGTRRITFSPSVFEIPVAPIDDNLVSVMMPFGAAFAKVYDAIKGACNESGFNCKRADEVWEHTLVIQDVFSLIYTSKIVICDFTGKNPNVFYEAGIAHTLGKVVVPISQSSSDVPFDLSHHRYLNYLSNSEGLAALKEGLAQRLNTLRTS